MRITAGIVLLLLNACHTSPLESAKQLANNSDYAGVLELLGAQGIDSTGQDALSLRAVAFFVENRMAEGFQDIEQIAREGDHGRFKAAELLMQAAIISAREKNRARDVIALLDSAAILNPSVIPDIANLTWQRGIEYLAQAGDAGLLYINFGIRHDQNILPRLRAHDPLLARRYEEMDRLVKVLPVYTAYGRKYFNEFGRFPRDLIELQTAYPEGDLKLRSGWEIVIDGREGKIVAMATAARGNPYGIKRGTVLYGG